MIAYIDLPKICPAPKTAVAIGMFDALHLGHMAVLNAMMENCRDLTPCVFTFTTNLAKPDAKSHRRLLNLYTRDKLFEKIGVKYVFRPEFAAFRSLSPEAFVKDFLTGYLNAKAVFCGEDLKFAKNASADAALLDKLLPEDSGLHAVKKVCAGGQPISTTRIRELVESGDIPAANELLGRKFCIEFPVEYGRQLGRRLNLPTINQALPDGFVIPRFGVYASAAVIDEKKYAAVTNIGVKPTVGSDHILAETHIMNYCGDLYGKTVEVDLYDHIRDEIKFDSIDKLKSQINKDIKASFEITGLA